MKLFVVSTDSDDSISIFEILLGSIIADVYIDLYIFVKWLECDVLRVVVFLRNMFILLLLCLYCCIRGV